MFTPELSKKDYVRIRKVASKVLAKYPRCYEDYEDLVQEGVIAWLEAARTFDSERGTSIVTYTWKRISGAMIDYLRGNYPFMERVKNQAVLVDMEEIKEPFYLPGTDSVIMPEMERAINALPELDKRIILDYYGEGLRMTEIGKQVGVSESYISLRHKHFMKQLRDTWEAA